MRKEDPDRLWKLIEELCVTVKDEFRHIEIALVKLVSSYQVLDRQRQNCLIFEEETYTILLQWYP